MDLSEPEASPSQSAQAVPNELLGALQNPALYDHPVKYFTVIETHISWVLLTGIFAYKIKKPVNFGFVDFSTLDRRHYFCTEELRLNRRFAADLYLDAIAIKGSPANPRLTGGGKAIEFAIKMREFPQHDLLSTCATEQRLEPAHIDSIADVVADFHSVALRAEPDSLWGCVDIISKWSRENFDAIESTVPGDILPKDFQALKRWCLSSSDARLSAINARQANGFVRECHGDLHLGNMAFINGQITPFDCIEFNEELRWIDTMSEVAFVAMDLEARDYPGFTWRFVNRYLQATGDYTGVALLRYYFVYRSLVRAKVGALHVAQDNSTNDRSSTLYKNVRRYLSLALSWSKNSRPAIIIMHGFSGSGKSTVSEELVEKLGAIQIRSDIERKRLSGFNPDDMSGSRTGEGIYTPDATRQTYNRLAELANIIIQAGYTVIVDGTFLKSTQRDQFKQLAEQCQVAYVFVSCEAPASVLRDRIAQRTDTGKDPSEATADVLQHQLQTHEVLTAEEQAHTISINSSDLPLSPEELDVLKHRITVVPGTGAGSGY